MELILGCDLIAYDVENVSNLFAAMLFKFNLKRNVQFPAFVRKTNAFN